MKLKSNASRPSLPKTERFEAQPSNVQLTKSAPATSQARKIQPPKSQSVLSGSATRGPVRAGLPKARLELIKPEAKSVFVAGSFNEWNPSRTPLTRKSGGKWVGDLSGITGRHEYLFVVDGQWVPDPNAQESVQNPFGGRNSVLVIAG